MDYDLLEILLAARSPSEFDRALRQHGPITDGEVPVLAAEADGSRRGRRINAVRALVLAPSPVAGPELRKLVSEAPDVLVWAIALESLLKEPGGSELAALRLEMIDAALEQGDPAALTVGLRAASLLGQTERLSLYRDLIDHEDHNVRDAAVAFLGTELDQSETILRNRLANESDPTVQSTIVRALLPSSNGDTIAGIKRIYNENERARMRLFNLFRLGGVASPWLDDFLLEIVATGNGNDKASAILTLGTRDDERVLPLCIDMLENTPTRGESGWVWAQHCADSCRKAINALARNERLTKEAALEWARAQIEHDDDK